MGEGFSVSAASRQPASPPVATSSHPSGCAVAGCVATDRSRDSGMRPAPRYWSALRVSKEPGDDLPQPSSLLRDRLMQSPSQLVLNRSERRAHAVPPGLSLELEMGQ